MSKIKVYADNAATSFPKAPGVSGAMQKYLENYGIMTRCGLHCAPAAHKTLGTYPSGTVRFSFGCLNTMDEIDYIIRALAQITRNLM